MDFLLPFLVMSFGVLIAGLSGFGLVAPAGLVNLVAGAWHRAWIFYLAVGMRVVLGAVLIGAASLSRYPLTFQVLGGISIVAALVLLQLGRYRIGRLLGWFQARPDSPLTRSACLLGLGFGVFLIHAVS